MSNHYDLTPDEADVFFEEATEFLESLDSDLVLVEHSSDDELINRIFRAIHTLKGAAGSIGHESMAQVAHAGETVLDKVRKHELDVTTEMVDVLFAVVDNLRHLLGDVVDDRVSTTDVAELVQRLQQLLVVDPDIPQAATAQLPPFDEEAQRLIEESVASGKSIVIVYASADPTSVAPLARLFQIYMELENLHCQVVAGSPNPAELERGEGQPEFVAVVATELHRTDLQDEIAQIPDLLSLEVADLTNAMDMFFATESDNEEATNWPRTASETDDAQQEAEDEDKDEDEDAKGRFPAEKAPAKRPQASRTVRTSIERLDNLMNLAGELVTDRNRLFKIYEDLSHTLSEEQLNVLNETISHLSTITDQLHDEVVKARMQPIEYVFNKFPRLVRQIAGELDKRVELVLTGQDTEVDRSVIEQVSDPLLHLVRNAIDHGIETVTEREQLGKTPVGRLELSARSEEGSIVITIADDGCGIDVEKVKQKAVSLGVINPEQATAMSHAEATDLIFAPGLTTASQVSDLSGRGVGMDVVRNNIQRLNGSVVVHSTPGVGTSFELRLPLTLAIIPTLLVEVHDQVFALPLHNVLEIFKLDPASVSTVRQREAAYVRGEILPLFRLAKIFGGLPQNSTDAISPGEARTRKVAGEFVVSLNHRESRFGVVVDRLLGKQDVVIKSLGYPINNVRGLSGATLLGDGRIGLIADVAALMEMVAKSDHAAQVA